MWSKRNLGLEDGGVMGSWSYGAEPLTCRAQYHLQEEDVKTELTLHYTQVAPIENVRVSGCRGN